ncbi:enoyl-CoA hydratase/isomerase family protein [Natronomonas sp. EA1]|uniref:enoyl-CoA hydratase/isomerase family protein n=1 Tax=Natronomonas sp. EA1 TaxID=3421655 RepID=UPI003EBF73F5
MSDEAVLVEVDDGVATLTLNRPENRNAMSRDMSRAIIEAIDSVEQHPEARCLVITGQEGTFCAGGDINAMLARFEEDTPLAEAVRSIQLVTSRAIQRLYEFHLPTVAKVDGVAFGAGANLAIAADCTVASTDAKISFGFRQVGLGVDTGTSYLLPRLVGENTAKELVLTGELLDAERAEDIGLFNHAYDASEFEERAGEFIETIAEGPTIGLENSVRLIRDGMDTTLKAAIDNEAAAQAAVLASEDHAEGAEAFMERRDPEFEGK